MSYKAISHKGQSSDETTFNNKLNEIKEQLKKEQGLEIEEVSNVRKKFQSKKKNKLHRR